MNRTLEMRSQSSPMIQLEIGGTKFSKKKKNTRVIHQKGGGGGS